MIRGLAVAAALALSALAQDAAKPRTLREASRALHGAWLREVMDRDVAGAAREYAAIAANEDPNTNPQRWIAVARLSELQRLGVVPPTPVPKALPTQLQPSLDATRTVLPTADLVQRATQPPEQVMKSVGSEAGRLPPLRPAVAAAQQWVREKLSARNYSGRWRGTPGGRRQDRDRIIEVRAADILQRELEGRQEQAESLRKFYFAEWQPPAVPDDLLGAVAKVRADLDSWIADRGVSLAQQNLLRALRAAFDQRAATDPTAALTFVRRLPRYADRLLGAPAGAASGSR